MTAGDIPSQFSGFTAEAAAGSALSGLSEGDIVNAKVVKDLGEGKYEVETEKGRMALSSKTQMNLGDKLSLEVVKSGAKILLSIIDGPTASSTPTTISNTTEGSQEKTSTSERTSQATDHAIITRQIKLSGNFSEIARNIPQIPPGSSISVGVATSGDGVALHFPNGEVISVEAALTTELLAYLESQGVTLEGMPQSADYTSEAAMNIDRLLVQTGISFPDGSANITQIDLPLNIVPSLAEAFAAMNGEKLQAVIRSYDPISGMANIEAGGIRLSISLPTELDLTSGSQASLSIDPKVTITGEIRIAVDDVISRQGVVEAAIEKAGLIPSTASREAATFLVREGVAVNRDNIQSLLELAVGHSGSERTAMLTAGARLLSHDVPISLPIVSGLAQIISEGNNISSLINQTSSTLQQALSFLPEGSPATASLEEALNNLEATAVTLDNVESTKQLANFLASFGRESFSLVNSKIETATAQTLAQNPQLVRLDQAVTQLQSALSQGTQAENNIPPGQAVTTQPQPEEPSTNTPQTAQAQDIIQNATKTLGDAETFSADQLVELHSQIARHPGTLPQHTEVPINPAQTITLSEVSSAIREIMETIDPAKMADAIRNIVENSGKDLARAVMRELESQERDILSRDPAVNRLSEASQSLRDIGRRFIAYKAENIATMRQEPAMFVAEVPFRMAEEDANGRLQVFYRRGKERPGSKRWQARVVLDLQTSKLGPIVGDMRFHRHEVGLTLYCKDNDTKNYLMSERSELIAAMHKKDFRAIPQFKLIPEAEEIKIKFDSTHTVSRNIKDNKLDIEA